MTADPKDIKLKLIVGLGNPGSKYEQTRHNAGFWFVEKIAECFNTSLRAESKFQGQAAKLNSHDCWLLCPNTFMNLSGQSVAAMAKYYQITPEEILVVHDELDLAPGEAKLKFAGGHAGHNGLRNIISALGGNKNFFRLRIGIGHPGNKNIVHDYVLSHPSKSDKQAIDHSINEALAHLPLLFDHQLEAFRKQLHTSATNTA